MGLQRVALIAAITAITVSLLYLLAWGLLWRVLVTSPLPPGLSLLPINALGCVLAGIGLWSAAMGMSPTTTRACAGLVILLGMTVLIQHLLRVDEGIEQLLFFEQARALLSGVHPGRPAPQAALTFLLIGLSLWFSASLRKARVDLADIVASGAVFVSFTAVIGH